ncbi:hypothetical protein J4G37_15785 [Microvirga sp. 3-52]|nr:hypothetical protein [Microvirga sp. 3-52]
MYDEVPGHTISLTIPARTQESRAYTIFSENSLEWRRSIGETTCCGSVLVIIRQELWLQNSPSARASLPFQPLNLPKKLCRECRFAPEAIISGIAAQAQLHITDSCFEGASKNA